MKKQTKKTLWRGLTSTSAVLMVVSLFGTQCAITYTGTLNSYLGTTTSRIVSTGDPSAEDTNYYTSEFGDYSAENLQKLIQATYDESVLEQEEGSVLLRNNNSALPLSSNSHVTLFGHAVVQPVYAPGGANSGAASTGTYVIDLYQALKDVGFSINDTLYDAYKNSSTSRVASNNLTISGGPNSTGDFNAAPVLGEEPKSFYTAQLQQSWENDYNDVAIVMLAREGGEDCEMMMEDPDGISALALHQDEKDMLAMIRDSGKFSKIVVLLNSAYPMELGWMDEYNVDACLWIGDPGQRGFEGVANLLTGKENPSGHLTDTYAANSLSSPAAYTQSQNVAEWSNVDEVLNSGIVTDSPLHVSYTATQAEGIYVGYKYYETRYEDSILNPASGASGTTGSSFGGGWNYAAEVTYPFGYGLSYTTFEQTLNSVSYDADQDMFTATVTVKNTGSVSGKSVVQLYVQTPYGDYEKQNAVEKSAVQVIGYGKTDELKPGQSEQVTVTMDRYMMASYDYTNAKGYILSAGDYYLALGDNAHDALNNILAAKGASGMVDQDGNTVEGNAAKTYRWNYDTLDTESYRYSVTGEEVTNQFDDCNANYWQEGSVTYLTRQDWNGTFPTEAPAITCTEEMMQILQVTVTMDRYMMASYDYTNAKGYILSAGDYYLALGDNAHDALNNILAAKGASGMVDQDGNTVEGNAAKTYRWNYDTLDTESYRYSVTGEEVTNQFDDCNANYWQEGSVTYLTRQDWNGTFPTKAPAITCTEEMMQILQGELYTKPEDSPSVSDITQGQNNGLTFVSMKDVSFDDTETWDKYLDQMTVEELASQISDMFGTPEVSSVAKPAFSEGDGTASVGANTFPEEYGDTRDVCLYPCSVVAACMWNNDRLTRRGELMAEEALYCKLPLFWTGGGNLHRTPFGGRNGEYFSEDAVLTNLYTTTELTAVQSRGVTPGIKHVAGNDQEFHREGLAVFFNEQAFREQTLRAFEGALSNENTMALMQSFNRLGLVWSSSSKALCTQVLRKEWGFNGQQETDGVAGGAYKSHFATSLSAGTTTYCIDPTGSAASAIVEEIRSNDDGNMLLNLRDAVKRYHYMLSHTNLINGLSMNATVESIMPWWQIALYAIDVVFALLMVGSLFMMFRAKRRSEEKA